MKAETFFYLVTRGRHSGLPRELELWFVEHAGAFYLLAESCDNTDWIENIRKNPSVSFSIGNRKNKHSEVTQTTGHGRVIDAREEDLCSQVRASLHVKYRWTSGEIVEIAPQPALS